MTEGVPVEVAVTGEGILGASWAALLRDRLLTHNMILSGGTVLAGFLGLLFHSLVSHRLQPGDYAIAFTSITLISLLGAPTSGVGLVATRAVSQALAAGHAEQGSALVRGGNRWLLVLGAGSGLLLAASAPWTGPSLKLSALIVVLTAASLPFVSAVPVLLGALQGQQRFGSLAAIYIFQAGAKLALAVGLSISFGVGGVVAGVTLASAATYAAAYVILRAQLRPCLGVPDWSETFRYGGIVVLSGLAGLVLLSTDVVMVKYFFSAQAAGEYSVIAVLGDRKSVV